MTGKTLYVKDISNDISVDSLFMIRRADLRAKRGEQYLHMTIADKTGIIEAKFYGEKVTDAARLAKVGCVYRIIGVGKTNPNGSLIVYSDNENSLDALLSGPISLVAGDDIEYIYTPANLQKNATELQKIVASIQNQNLRIFVTCCLDNRFYECPAAIRRHHEYTGGLCEHTLETVQIVLHMMEIMPRMKINRDIAIAGAVLHDIGKIFCFDKVNSTYVPNDTYNLVEHITMGIMHIDQYKDLLTDSELLQLRHIIQSHHGIYGDVVPLTAEAWLVNEADGASARMRSILDDLNDTPSGQKKKGLRSEKFLWKAV
ncbi:MAG TPA: HD domain-containing protein [Methanocorpusculum sp.]|nr:HD domain-containing protein [Methanocorpusculum sp.]